MLVIEITSPPFNGHLTPPYWALDPLMMGTRSSHVGHMTAYNGAPDPPIIGTYLPP